LPSCKKLNTYERTPSLWGKQRAGRDYSAAFIATDVGIEATPLQVKQTLWPEGKIKGGRKLAGHPQRRQIGGRYHGQWRKIKSKMLRLYDGEVKKRKNRAKKGIGEDSHDTGRRSGQLTKKGKKGPSSH